MDRKRVIIVTDTGLNYSSASCKRVNAWVKGFDKNNCSVSLYMLGISNKAYYLSEKEKNKEVRYYINKLAKIGSSEDNNNKTVLGKIVWLFVFYIGAIAPFFKFIKNIKFNQRKESVVFFYGRSLILLLPFMFVSKLFGYKTAYDIVEEVNSFKVPYRFLNIRHWDQHFGQYVVVKFADSVTAISSALKHKYQALQQNLNVTPSIFDFDPDYSPVMTVAQAQFNLLYIGALIEKDDPMTMLKAMEVLSEKNLDFKLVLAGKYKDTKEGEYFFKRVEQIKGLSNRIIDFGKFKPDEHKDLIESCNGIILLRGESDQQLYSFPLRLVEFLNSGKPVFTTSFGDIPMYLSHKKDSFLIKPCDGPGLAEQIEWAISNPIKAAIIGQNGFNRSKEVFNSQTWAKILLTNLFKK